MSASLGFQSLRPKPTTTLPGTAGNAVPRRMAPRGKTDDALLSGKIFKQIQENPPANRTASKEFELAKSTQAKPAAKETLLPSTGEGDECSTDHFVYAMAKVPCRDVESGDNVAEADTPLFLVYPMRENDDTGEITMRAKVVDPTNGQLSYHWVRVYDTKTDVAYVGSFSLFPP